MVSEKENTHFISDGVSESFSVLGREEIIFEYKDAILAEDIEIKFSLSLSSGYMPFLQVKKCVEKVCSFDGENVIKAV